MASVGAVAATGAAEWICIVAEERGGVPGENTGLRGPILASAGHRRCRLVRACRAGLCGASATIAAPGLRAAG